jgi:hypothetical protein
MSIRKSVLILLLAGSASADADPSQRAREHFDRGTTAYDLGRYEDAAHEYEEAYAIKSVPALLFDAAQAFRLAGDHANAVRSYRSYLRRVPGATNSALVEKLMASEQKLLDQAASDAGKASGASTSARPQPQDVAPPNLVPEHRSTRGADAVVQITDDPEVPQARPRTLVYKKWWLWTTIGAVVAAGIGVGVGVGLTTSKNAPSSPGAPFISFP